MTDRARPSRVLTILAAGCVAAVALAACSSSAGAGDSPTSASSSNRPTAGSTARPGGGFGGGFGPRAAAQGEIAQISGRTLQVQNTTTQTAVTYATATRFTITKAATLAAVKVGSCVFATSASSSGNSTAVTATNVRITPARSGNCLGNGVPRADRTGAAPSNIPTRRPSGAPSGFRGAPGGFGGVAGKVTSVSGSTIKVTTLRRSANASPTTGSAVISVTAATKYTATSATTSAAAKVGLCAVVQGKTDSRGAVAATAIELSGKVNGSCTVTTGFPRGRFGGPSGAPGAGGAGNGNS